MNNRRTVACIGKNNGIFFITDTTGGIRCYRRHIYVLSIGLCLTLRDSVVKKLKQETDRTTIPHVPHKYLHYCP